MREFETKQALRGLEIRSAEFLRGEAIREDDGGEARTKAGRALRLMAEIHRTTELKEVLRIA